MQLTVNKLTALRIIRSYRSTGHVLPQAKLSACAPDSTPHGQWRRTYLTDSWDIFQDSSSQPVDVVVSCGRERIQAKGFSNSIYGKSLGREASFWHAGNGLLVSCPELLFVEMATVMPLPFLVLLGYELCGSFSRDPLNPRTGNVTYGVPPATSVATIREYAQGTSVKGATIALRALSYVADNAWSPMEAILATMLTLPVLNLGYGLGRIELNVRHENARALVARGCRESRVPDIIVSGTPLGFNYDGKDHFRLDNDSALREKYVDDLRRNRELEAQGLLVMPVTFEDLFHEGGLDIVLIEAAQALKEFGDYNTTEIELITSERGLCRERQELLWSLLPWPDGAKWAQKYVERLQGTWPANIVEEVVRF